MTINEPEKLTPFAILTQFEFWMGQKTTAQQEIHKLRQLCPHENRCATTRSDFPDIPVITVHCSDCGKWPGDEDEISIKE